MTVKLRVVHVRIPGQWNDGWLYKEHLILWSRTGEMYVTELAALLDKLHAQLTPNLAVVADYAIFRNNWKSSDQFKRIIGVDSIRRTFFKDFPQLDTPLTSEIKSLDLVPSRSEAIPGFMLDVSLYADRIYAGSSDGLFESRFDPKHPETRMPVVQRLEEEVSAVNAKNSVVNSSAGDNGLKFSHVDFDDGHWWDRIPKLFRTANVSYNNSFASYHVLNYTNEAFPTFLRAETDNRPTRADGSGYQESRVVGYRDQADISRMASAAINRSRPVKLSESQSLAAPVGSEPATRVLGNSEGRLLIHWHETLRVVDISAQKGKDISARADPKYGERIENTIPPSSVLRTYAIESGFLVELFDKIHLITPAGSYLVASQEAARIRTFVFSRRYQDMALIVGEGDVTLVGFVESPD
jgi:hypothetical protein